MNSLWAPEQRPPAWEEDTLFLMDPRDEAHVLSEGGRLAGEYSDYFAPSTARAQIVPGPFSRRGVASPGGYGEPRLVYPVDGLLPTDEYTVTFWVRSRDGDLAGAGAEIELLRFGCALRLRLGGRLMSAAVGEQVTRIDLGTGSHPAGEWAVFTVTMQGGRLTLRAPAQDHESSVEVALLAATGASGVDGGLTVLDGAPAPHDVEVAEIQVNRYARSAAVMTARSGPEIRVDASVPAGRLPPYLGGGLGLYTGFRNGQDGANPDTGTAIRDAQFAACAAAGLPLVRLGGAVSSTPIHDRGPGAVPRYEYDFTHIDDKMRVLGEAGVGFHLTLDYNHPLTGAGDDLGPRHIAAPSDFSLWAHLASEILAHLRKTWPVKSVALWNEPELPQYWGGSVDEYHQLWKVVQQQFMTDHPDMLLGTGDHAHPAGLNRHLDFIAAEGLPVSAMYLHSFRQDLEEVRAELADVRQHATALGLGHLPLRITEWSLALEPQMDRYTRAQSVVHAWPNRFRGHQAAAFTLAFLNELVAADPLIDMATFCSLGAVEVDWLTGAGKSVSDETMFTSTFPPRPTPSFNAMSLYWKLGEQRVSASSNWPSLRALATRSGGVTTVVYGSYRPWRPGDTVDIAFVWDGLPECFKWRHWQVDAEHGADGRLMLVGEGTENDLPLGARLGVLGLGCIEVTGE
ncbi:MAG: hypothetical protein ABR573_10680 [Candidatus Dormibacteria bacterium]